MNILILGSGGREHAFAWKISQSPRCDKLFIAPGNAGTAAIAENVDISPTAFPEIGDFVVSHQVDLVVVGPEVPLALGIKDYFLQRPELRGVMLVGPDQQGAQLESSKDFAKRFMMKYHIPTAAYATFDQSQIEEGIEYLESHQTPIVLKADGLAAGKGVVICNTRNEAVTVFKEMLVDARFGQAGAKVVVEEFMTGVEISVFVLTDGSSYKILPSAKDYKRIGEQDTGPNTGGMGAVSPVPFADEHFMDKVREQIIEPTIRGIQSEGLDYRGFIFLGLINVAGEPKVIEYNARMGDPETQAVLPRINSDLVDLLEACATGHLDQIELEIAPQCACTVVMVAGGYPGKYQKGLSIHGLENVDESLVFHAGTAENDGTTVTNGGRVLAITGIGETIDQALHSSYNTIEGISWDDAYYRKDIGKDMLEWLNKTLETSTD